ncbi:primosomal protein N' [Haloimpatiens sp. FM7315]|uniref:primosomal protein N' n=1 Tax=Haloimpatiens sp. FM7315 TaxID=3298609 RepID=UPI00370A5F0D
MCKYAGVIVENESEQVDRIFTYEVPDKFKSSIKVGSKVKVPFGKGNRVIVAYVVELFDKLDKNIKNIKFIKYLNEGYPLLDNRDIELIKLMKRKYLCTYLDCIKCIVPSSVQKGMGAKMSKVISLKSPLEGKYVKEPYIIIYELVKEHNGSLSKSAISKKYNVSISSINTLIKHGFFVENEVVVNRFDQRIYKEYKEKVLNDDQRRVVDSIMNSNKTISLIHGITGSGKTEIYMHLVSIMMKKDMESIILVPEIALTPQMVERFKGRFGKDIAVFHSKLSDGERFDEWLRVKNNKVKLAVGARSAIFLPFSNLGLIVIDEEHEGSYKSESSPKYSAYEIAVMRSKIEGCKVILGSATPSIETYYNAKEGSINLLSIKNRVDGSYLPEVKIVDMREELLKNNRTIFSEELFKSIDNALNKKQQCILFLNRRGFSTFVSCRQCGYVFKCKNCDISLTYHNDSECLSCHYCGTKNIVPKSCPQCGSKYVKYFGIGTERVEKDVHKYFPKAKTIRMDFDTTRKKHSYEYMYESFKNHKADILIGTQMIAKGLDFPNVTLVGIIAADLSLNLPDFRASERTFQLITQVSGRAGRGKNKGKVVIQTYSPDSYSIKCAALNDYEGFYNREISIRKDMNYPPFLDMLCINMNSEYEDVLIKNIQKVGIYLKSFIESCDKIDMLGPCPCSISKIKNSFRWQIILKGQINLEYAKKIKNIVYELIKEDYNSIRVSMDINPINML